MPGYSGFDDPFGGGSPTPSGGDTGLGLRLENRAPIYPSRTPNGWRRFRCDPRREDRKAIADSLQLMGEVRQQFGAETSHLLWELFAAKPNAGDSDIREVLLPVRNKYAARMGDFESVFYPMIVEIAESRHLALDSRKALLADAAAAVTPLISHDLATPPEQIRHAIEPLLQKYPAVALGATR
jgi:hypothetical protein